MSDFTGGDMVPGASRRIASRQAPDASALVTSKETAGLTDRRWRGRATPRNKGAGAEAVMNVAMQQSRDFLRERCLRVSDVREAIVRAALSRHPSAGNITTT